MNVSISIASYNNYDDP